MSTQTDVPSRKKRRMCKDIGDFHLKIEDKPVKKHKKRCPKFRLKNAGELASVNIAADSRVPLVLTDVQHLLLHSLFGNINLTQSPRWYVLDKCHDILLTTCLIIEGASIKHWKKYSDSLNCLDSKFSDLVEVITPTIYKGSLVEELALVPLSESEKEDLIQKYGSMNLALEIRKDLMTMIKAFFPVGNEVSESVQNPVDKFPRTQLVLSAWQLIEENYPVPLNGKLINAYSDYVMTKCEYSPVTANSPMFGIDCEMCLTNAGSELTRVSIVNESHKTIYETFVKPYNNITDYLTRYSGITESILNNVTKRLEDVQNDLQNLLPSDAILVGQSLNTDLHALKMMHPYIIDTSLIYNFTGERTRKPKLKSLAREFLQQDIQSSKKGHCSIEDSLASLKLVQLKLSKNIEFGDAVHTSRKDYKDNKNKPTVAPQYGFSLFNHVLEQKKSSIIIGCDDITGLYHTYLSKTKQSIYSDFKKTKPKKVKLVTVDTVSEVIDSLTKSVGEFNFAMGHIKLDINNENESDQMETIQKWIGKLSKTCDESNLCVIVFSGTANDNGLAMIKLNKSA